MRAVKSKDTAPEILVRSLVHGLGYPYTLHNANLPDKPDIIFTKRKKIIFIHGCFWHGHRCKRGDTDTAHQYRILASKNPRK